MTAPSDCISTETPVSINLAAIDRELEQFGRTGSLSLEWERLYDRDTADSHRRLTQVYLILAAVVSLICVGIDILSLSLPMQAVFIRVADSLACLALFVMLNHPRFKDYAHVAIVIVIAGVMLTSGYLGRLGAIEMALLYNVGSLTAVLLALIGLPLTSRSSAVVAGICGALFTVFIWRIAELPVTSRISAIVYFGSLVGVCLVLRATMRKAEHRRFLFEQKDDALQRELHRSHEVVMAANRQLEAVARLDGLTGIPNRRYFDEALQRLIDAFASGKRDGAFTLVLLDVDYFKRFNDNYGHLAGDDCLRAVARRLQTEVNGHDEFVARYGGEEFVALIADPIPERASARLIRATQALQLVHRHRPDGENIVTVSAGVTVIDRFTAQSGAANLIANADRALYRAKDLGRNRAMVA